MLAFSVKPVCVNNLKSILLYILHLLDDNDLHTVCSVTNLSAAVEYYNSDYV